MTAEDAKRLDHFFCETCSSEGKKKLRNSHAASRPSDTKDQISIMNIRLQACNTSDTFDTISILQESDHIGLMLLIELDSLRKGRSEVVEQNHTLILGWSDKLGSLLNQLVIANESLGGGIVVVMAERNKEEMELDIVQVITSLHGNIELLIRRSSLFRCLYLK